MGKKKFKIYKLKFTSPIHLSRGKGDDDYSKSEEFIHSDTLKSALFSTAILLNPDLNEKYLGEKYFSSFKVSSTFPYYKDTLFLPKPKGKLPFSDVSEKSPTYDFKKDIKKLSFIEFDLFLKFFKNKYNKLFINNLDFTILSHKYLVSPAFSETITSSKFNLTNSEVQERVYIRKMNEIHEKNENKFIFSDPYIIDKIYFTEEAGLYFLLEHDNDFDLVFFERTLKELGEFGIGTDRNVGNGQFTLNGLIEKEIDFDDNAEYLMAMSLFLPTKSEVESFTNRCQYKLLMRGGWISNWADLSKLTKNELKKFVYMIDEASIFENNQVLVGKFEDLKPDNSTINHPVWRDGRAIFFPINNIKL